MGGWYSAPGLAGVNPGHKSGCQAPILSLLGKPLTYVGLVMLTMPHHTFACASRDDLLPGMFQVGSEGTWFSSRESRLMIGRYPGEDAVLGSHEVGDWNVPHPTSVLKL